VLPGVRQEEGDALSARRAGVPAGGAARAGGLVIAGTRALLVRALQHSRSSCLCKQAPPEGGAFLPGIVETERELCEKATRFALAFLMLGWEALLLDSIHDLTPRAGCFKLLAVEKRKGVLGAFVRCGEPVLEGLDVCREHSMPATLAGAT